MLGYQRYKKSFPKSIAEFGWLKNDNDAISFVGVELSLYRNEDNLLQVETRTRMGRSYWDLAQQNRTIMFLKKYIGGRFVTDEGPNRLMCSDATEPPKLPSGLYLARWIYNNALIKPKLFLDQREMKGQIAASVPTGFDWMDSLNPRFFSNNLLIPYFVAIWEDYLKSSYLMILRHTTSNDRVYKNANLNVEDLRLIAEKKLTVEEAIVEKLSFQRPNNVCANFKALDEKLDIYSVLRKPYNRRKETLFETIDKLVDLRNAFVHSGYMDTTLTDEKIQRISSDFVAAADRIYQRFGDFYSFTPRHDY